MILLRNQNNILYRLWFHIGKKRRQQFILLILMTIIGSLAEILSLGSIVPFIGAITNPEDVLNSALMNNVSHYINIQNKNDLIGLLSGGFIFFSVLTGIFRILLVWISSKYVYGAGSDLGCKVFSHTIYQPYKYHLGINSSNAITNLTKKIDASTGVLSALVSIVTSAILFLAIISTLFVIDPFAACIAGFIFGGAYMAIGIFTKKRIASNGEKAAAEHEKIIRSIQEGVGGIRDIIIDGTQSYYCETFRQSSLKIQKATSENIFMATTPRFALEALGLALVGFMILFLNYLGNPAFALPVLGLLAFAAQRSLPLMQQLYGSWSTILSSKTALVDVLNFLDEPIVRRAPPAKSKLYSLADGIEFNQVGFRYGDNYPWVLRNISFTIPRGARIGIIGSTGSGKSTTLDLLMGLLEPTEGRVTIDGQDLNLSFLSDWQKTIAHVSQNIFLADATIEENIAFGIPRDEIDFERVRAAAQQAKILDFIEGRPDGYKSVVGERGIRLSGGQRQRIGIARALYKNASVLILDEATSALDNKTEELIMNEVEYLSSGLTIIIVAHRLTTLKHCSQIIEIQGGAIKALGSLGELAALR